MPILVISDIHANLNALESVLQDAGTVDQVFCLGDLVGYGPDPNECVQLIRSLPNLVCLMGNHDAAILGLIDSSAFNSDARASLLWLDTVLSEENRQYLGQLDEMWSDTCVTLAHGSPRNPIWEYVLDSRTARGNFNYFSTPHCLIGHSHLPVLYFIDPEDNSLHLDIPADRQPVQLPPRALLNPGSVGQPRDHDPRASYALLDIEQNTWEIRRTPYDIAAVQQRIQKAGLPLRHALRLAEGI